MKLELTIQDKYDLMLLICAIDGQRQRSMQAISTITKPTSAWKDETERELERLEQIRAQLEKQMIE